ncbi:MAG: cupin domain-containing protein [Sphingomicrobium sp.]
MPSLLTDQANQLMSIATTNPGPMVLRAALAIALCALGGCGPSGDDKANQAGARPGVVSAAAASSPTVTPILRTGHTISDQPLKLPPGAAEMVAVAVDIPAGGTLPIHKHPWSRFFYVERGTLRVVNHDTGASMDFKTGQVQAEAIGQWHAGSAVGPDPVRVIVIDLVPTGVDNTIMKPITQSR